MGEEELNYIHYFSELQNAVEPKSIKTFSFRWSSAALGILWTDSGLKVKSELFYLGERGAALWVKQKFFLWSVYYTSD